MKVLVDTCVLIDFLRGNKKIGEILLKNEDLVVNSVVYMEIIRGARDKIELNKLRKFLNIFEIIEIDERISYKARHLIDNYSLSIIYTLQMLW